MMYAGPEALSDSELLALIIRTGTGDMSAVQLAEEVLAYASVHIGDPGRADPRELTEIRGIGTAKACSIVAALELSKRFMSCRVMESEDRMATAEDVSNFLQREMVHEKRELFMSVHLNTRLQIESKYIVSIGSLDAAPVHPREVFGPAVKRGAAAVIVAHNHPSGTCDASAGDVYATEVIMMARECVGVKLLDHYVVAGMCAKRVEIPSGDI
jgi:DNA repair protein RadC